MRLKIVTMQANEESWRKRIKNIETAIEKSQGVCLVGHPDYYRKLGFKNEPGLVHEGVPREVFFALSFDGHIPQGTVTFHEAFKADGQ